jgi:hypothetical protein
MRAIVTSQVFLIAVLFILMPASILATTKECKNIATALIKEFRQQGWHALTFEAAGQDYKTIKIVQKNVIQEKPLTEGQLKSALGTILKPDIVERLKTSGFEKGIFVDGRSRSYPFGFEKVIKGLVFNFDILIFED